MGKSKYNDSIIIDPELLDIFPSEEIYAGTDISKMSDHLIDAMSEKAYSKIRKDKTLKTFKNLDGLEGPIINAIKAGIDISNSGVYIADNSHFSADIIDKLKRGVYKIAESKVAENRFRPAIVDQNGTLVKFFTLKKAKDTSLLLTDFSNIATQRMLHKISGQIKHLQGSVDYLIRTTRDQNYYLPFYAAKDCIIDASDPACLDQKDALKEALNQLNKGENGLYKDMETQIERLSHLRDGMLSASKLNMNDIDEILGWLCEDFDLLICYVSLHLYLLNLLGNKKSTESVLSKYKVKMKQLNEEKYGKKEASVAQIIHMYFKYNNENMDQWLIMPDTIVKTIENRQKLLEDAQNKEIYYIDEHSTADKKC